MSTDLTPPDELASAEATLRVLQQVTTTITADDLAKQTPCSEFDVAALTDHLLNSITQLGKAAGATIPERDSGGPLESQITAAARPALDAWHRRGLDGTVPFGQGEVPATLMAGILSLEFLVHAWDYASATGGQVTAPDEVVDYVMGIAKRTISPDARSQVGFAEAVSAPAQASALDQLVAFTGRVPERS